MTREEFYRERQRIAFERDRGITRCAPGAAQGSAPMKPRLSKSGGHHAELIRAAARMDHLVDEESGEAKPVTVQKIRLATRATGK